MSEDAADREPHLLARLRDEAGRHRDLAGANRDEAGRARDAAADDRDRLADEQDAKAPVTRGASAVAKEAATDRVHAQHDRAAGAGDRARAAQDRSSALADRTAAARDRHHASLDLLTRVYTRQAGLLELERDFSRARRGGHHLVVAFVDVDHLKETNDAYGHSAGDQLLTDVADSLRAALRPHDLILRYGGDEFLCVIEGIDAVAAGPRFDLINELLSQKARPGSVTVGVAQLQPDDTSQTLIDRADAHLYQQRHLR